MAFRSGLLTCWLALLATAADLPAQAPPAGRSATQLFHLGLEAHRSGRNDIAAQWFAEAVALDPEAVLPRLEWAGALQSLRRFDEAVSALAPLSQRIDSIGTTAPEEATRFYRISAAAMLAAKRPAESIPLYEKAAAYAPADIGLRAQLIGLYRLNDRPEAALPHLEAAAELVPGNLDLRLQLGKALLDLGRWAEAENAFRRALSLKIEHEEAWDGLGLALAGQGRYQSAEEAYRAGLRVAPASSRLYEHLGDALLEDGRPAAALDAYRRAATLGPGERPRIEAKIERARTSTP